jgi:MoaA/NifB/PqqE/SkfB family radical SAM enzyme
MKRTLAATANWEITRACNLHCIHCYNNSGNTLCEELSLDEAKSIVDQLADFGVIRICIGGGEPLLRNDILELLDYITRRRIGIVLSTNGTLLTSDVIATLGALRPRVNLKVSLDGANSETHDRFRGARGCFEKAINSIRMLVNAGIPTGINTVISKFNLVEIPAILDLGFRLGVDYMVVSLLLPVGNAMQLRDILLDSNERDTVAKIIAKKEREYSIPIRFSTPTIVRTLRDINTFDITPSGDVMLSALIPLVAGNLRHRNLSDLLGKLSTAWEDFLGSSKDLPIVSYLSQGFVTER